MIRKGSTLLIFIYALSTSCIFSVDHEMDDAVDYGDATVNIQGPGELFVDADADDQFRFVVDYEVDCAPPGCDEDLWCAVEQGADVEPEFSPCDDSFSPTEQDVDQGVHTARVQLRDGDDVRAEADTKTTVLFDFSLHVAGLDDADQPLDYIHSFRTDIACTADCRISCTWLTTDGDIIEDEAPECDDESVTVELPEDHDNAYLAIIACADIELEGDDEHCLTTRTFGFHSIYQAWESVDTGERHSCAISTAQSLWCWGDNRRGQVGVGDSDHEVGPQNIELSPLWIDVATASHHSCAVDNQHGLYCWGDNTDGQVEPGATGGEVAPVVIDDDFAWQAVSAGNAHSCAITVDGDLYCWGADDDGQLGSNSDDDGLRNVELPDDYERWSQVSAGRHHTCAIAVAADSGDDRGFCWGRSDNGRLGLGTSFDDDGVPEEIDLSLEGSFVDISAGDAHSCAVFDSAPDTNDESTQILCWGRGDDRQIGHSSDEDQPSPVEVPHMMPATIITAGMRHSCAVIDELPGSGFCWGQQEGGRLGNGYTTSRNNSPAPITSEVELMDISAGGEHSCAIVDDGELLCWGQNRHGQLGTGDNEDYTTPKSIYWSYPP